MKKIISITMILLLLFSQLVSASDAYNEKVYFDVVSLGIFAGDENGELRDIFVEDGLHLTDSGYEEMAAWLTPKVKALLD